ncbi:hypothetical protein M0804_007962 [Polistes exclamans]|nr:hypothetical protein M0804_007962 [Polistes exclamans]
MAFTYNTEEPIPHSSDWYTDEITSGTSPNFNLKEITNMNSRGIFHRRSCHVQQRGICVTLVLLSLIIGTILFAYTALASSVDENDTIEQVSFLFRHGDRTPLHTYLADPYINYSWPGGWGALTTKGMRQLYNVGKWIRKTYGPIVGFKYNSSIVYVRSSDSDRCIMSAQTLLAGLYPPTVEEIFVPNMPWRPIPVHTIPRELDDLITVKAYCPNLENALNQARYNESKRSDKMLADYYDELSNYTQQPVRTILDVEFLYNVLEIEADHGLELPQWTKKYFNEKMRNLAARSIALLTSNTLLKRLYGGPLLKEVVNKMQEKIIRENSRRAYFYSVHDITMVNVLRTMGFTNEWFLPEYGATLIFELHSYYNEDREVKVSYLNNSETIKPHPMEIPNCKKPCLLSNLLHIWKEVLPENWEEECLIWLSRDENGKQDLFENVTEGLKKIYRAKLLPLEQHYQFHDFHSPQLDDPDFDAKPMILLVGQYSTGKTTFIKYLLEREFPGIRIGPEPTTDRFIAVMYDEKEGVIPGNALVVDPNKQFRPLSKFGNAFLNRFQCSTVSSPVLKGISIVDTPGILSGEKQRVDRGYDFTGVLEWFAERVDRIILLFDAHKLDISDEFRRSIEALRGHDDKIRIVLNKADMIDHQQLMRVYGALMWSLGKVLQTPEVARVYIGSFWDQPLRYDVNRRLFEDEEQDLFRDMQSLPRNAALRKLNDLIKRARLAKVHAYIISALRKDMPSMFGKDSKKKELIKNLGQIYDQIQREHQISPGDFPNLKKMQESLMHHDFSKFNPIKIKLLEVVDKMLAEDIAKLMAMIPHEEVASTSEPLIKGGAFEGVEDQISPFGYKRGEGIDAGAGEPEWIVNKDRYKYDSIFETLGPTDGKITGAAAKSEMIKSKLPNSMLGKIWKLSDIDKDGLLDSDEFALAMHLINVKLEGYDLPAELPDHLIPPSKRDI